jgi:hypothetical protein
MAQEDVEKATDWRPLPDDGGPPPDAPAAWQEYRRWEDADLFGPLIGYDPQRETFSIGIAELGRTRRNRGAAADSRSGG